MFSLLLFLNIVISLNLFFFKFIIYREAASCLIGDILLSSNPLCPRVRPFSYSAWWIQLLNGWMSTCGWLAVFPRLKGRANLSLFFLFSLFGGVGLNR
jgi:hypothetical protein